MKMWSDGEWYPDDWEGTEQECWLRQEIEQLFIERRQALAAVNEFLKQEVKKQKLKAKAVGG